MPQAGTQVIITPVYPTGPAVGFALLGDSELQPVTTSGQGGLQIVDRPRLVAAIQWVDRSPWQLDLPLRLSSEVTYGNPGTNMEVWCQQVKSWMYKNTTTQQPPVLSITGPVEGIEFMWMAYTIDMTTAIRDPNAGFRVQQDIKLTLYEYNSPLQTTLNSPSPALAAQTALNNASGQNSYYEYTARAGDNLVTIAAALLGDYLAWTALASLNNIRDPNNVVVGQTILVPD